MIVVPTLEHLERPILRLDGQHLERALLLVPVPIAAVVSENKNLKNKKIEKINNKIKKSQK